MSLPSKLMVGVNLFFIALLVSSYLSLFISPVKFWLLAFAGLAYPLILLVNLFFVLFWLIFLKKYFLLSLLAILLGYNQTRSYIKLTGSERKLSFENSIKMMSYNVRLFDLYNWRNKLGKTTRKEIFDLIHSESPDILCIQDYYSGAGKHADFADTISKQSGYKYHSVELFDKKANVLAYGLAIFSKYPIIGTKKLEFPNSRVNFCQSVDVLFGHDTLRIMNLHFESVKFGKEDYNFVSDITAVQTANEDIKKGSLAIFGKMKQAFMKRAVQSETVAEYIRNSPYPVLLAGDFNDTPVSYSYRQIANELDDTFVDEGKGLGQTHTQMLPMLRIDYIFHSETLQTIEHKTIAKDYSDHFPVVARFVLSE